MPNIEVNDDKFLKLNWKILPTIFQGYKIAFA